jgi:hypothetical protein
MPDTILDDLLEKLNLGQGSAAEALREVLSRDNADASQLFDRLIARTSDLLSARRAEVATAASTVAVDLSVNTRDLVDSEQDRARAFVFSLAAAEQDTAGIQAILDDVVRKTTSLAYAADMVHFSQPRYNGIITNWNNVNHEQLAAAFDEQASRELLGTGEDIISRYPRFWLRITHQWRDRGQKQVYWTS